MAKTKKKTTTTSNNKRRRPGDPEISGCDDATLCPKKKTPRKKLSGGREDRTTLPSASFQAADNGKHDPNSSAVVRTLQCLDPILQWLTKRSGQPVIAAPVLYRALPPAVFGGLVPGGTDRSTNNQEDGEDSTEHHQQPENTAAGANAGHNNSALVLLDHIRILCRCNVLHCAEMPPDAALSSSSYLDTYNSTTTRSRTSQVATTTTSNSPTTINASGVGGVRSWDDATWGIGFPLPTTTASSSAEPSLHGSTRAAAKRRLACLWRHLLLQQPEKVPPLDSSKSCDGDSAAAASDGPTKTVAPTRTAPWDAKIEQHDSSTSATMDSSMSPMVKNNCHSDNGVPPQESHRQELQQQPGSPCHSPDNNDDIDLGAQFLDEREGRQALQSVFGFSVEGTPTTTSAEDTECRGSSECMSDSTVTGNQRTGFSTTAESTILPLQASYAGSVAAQAPVYAELSDSAKRQVPWQLLHAIGIYDEGERMDSNKCQGRHETTNETAFPSTNDDWKEKSSGGNNSVPLPARKRLFSHQVAAIEAALAGIHCSICTGTGSGKSLCFLLPALTAAYRYDRRSLILFPTKALAQDQLSKLQSLLAQAAAVRRRRGRGSDGNNCVDEDNDWTERIRPATLDGDTSHADRGRIGSSANIILTNPDTLHAAILPGWRTSAYRPILEALQYVIIDEAHSYHGIFGSHVALVLRRLVRVCAFASMDSDSVETDRNVGVTFISASATLPWPKEHFRRLCPVGEVTPVKILTSNEDGSPRSAKHFFVWNPPVLHPDGKPTDQVTFPQIEKSTDLLNELEKRHSGASTSLDPKPDQIYKNSDDVEETDDSGPLSPLTLSTFSTLIKEENYDIPLQEPSKLDRPYKIEYYRRHAADETARLLAKAIVNDIRCIAFCRSRNLVEWVYSKALEILQSDPSSAKLSSRLESYRGGYSLQERRKIEERLFNYQVLGVVGTNALELGVDIGGIELTLHCGYPSSYASLLQQVRLLLFVLWFPLSKLLSHRTICHGRPEELDGVKTA